MKPVVDLSAVREITDGDADIERELFLAYIESSVQSIAALKTGCGPNKESEWREQAHAFKGTSLNLGARRLGDLCKEAQDNFKASAERKSEMISAIETEFGCVKEFLETFLASSR